MITVYKMTRCNLFPHQHLPKKRKRFFHRLCRVSIRLRTSSSAPTLEVEEFNGFYHWKSGFTHFKWGFNKESGLQPASHSFTLWARIKICQDWGTNGPKDLLAVGQKSSIFKTPICYNFDPQPFEDEDVPR